MMNGYGYEVVEALETTEAIFAARLNGGVSSSEERNRWNPSANRQAREVQSFSYVRNVQKVIVPSSVTPSVAVDRYPYNRYSGSMDWKDAIHERCGR